MLESTVGRSGHRVLHDEVTIVKLDFLCDTVLNGLVVSPSGVDTIGNG